ncbi:MAG: hypothetical protein IJX96_00315 [Clostridia bacterium]|nr:hypothetical protein [Clostridia bacterium]
MLDERKNVVYKQEYEAQADLWQTPLGVCDFKLEKEGYYTIETEVERL